MTSSCPVKKTAVFYHDLRYLILLHSSYQDGNILKPLEAEFLRYFIEYWGDVENDYIQSRFDELNGSRVFWYCNENLLFDTTITSSVRLSYSASKELWLKPQNLYQILQNREGVSSEWVGDLQKNLDSALLLSFCGWGPRFTGDARFYYYRYIIQLDLNQ